MSDDAVFRALADPSRRELLDRLRDRNGRTSRDLCLGLTMSRQAVAKHLSILEAANLVSTERKGREKLHFMNPVPIADVVERWMGRFERPRPNPLLALRRTQEADEDRPAAPKVTVVEVIEKRLRPNSLRALQRSQEAGGDGLDDHEAVKAGLAEERPRTSPQVASPSASNPHRGLRHLLKSDDSPNK